MLILAGLLLWVIALGMQVVPTSGLRFNFSEVQQCQQFTVSFAGSNLPNTSIPASLSFLPINSTALSVQLPNPSLVSNGILLSAVPFPAGSNFLTSLDDATGENLIFVSDLIRVLPSTEKESNSCLPVGNSDAPRRFTISSEVTQCEELTINYDTSVVSKAPIVRLFNPKGPSRLLNMTSDDNTHGSAKYLMNFSRGKEILLLMEGGGFRETSAIITIGGDAASSSACLRRPINMSKVGSSNGDGNEEKSESSPIPSKAIIIGSAIGGSVVALVALSIIIFIIRDRQRRRKMIAADVETSQWKKKISEEWKTQQISNSKRNSPIQGGIVANPIYAVHSSFLSPTNSKFQRISSDSWVQVASVDRRLPESNQHGSPQPSSRILVQSPRSEDRVSLQSLDIEGMLNMATLQSENNQSRKNSVGTVQLLSNLPSSPSLAVPVPTYLSTETSSFHRRDPSDVPAGPVSMSFSGYSVNPFDPERNSVTPPGLENTLRSSRPIGGVGLPGNPRDVGKSSKGRAASTYSGRSSSDWYGIAR
ncbi:hypothetical protein JR316_0007224 [Psilocybe cubensis]|uniref:Mid2 domain-containing protein n=2 Tax=Psilocybe cubensis TaxID=181762 RepID=A0A8H7XR40_PSICU|nr:hypothetical protein JR316_0007224 [Psilocybe cubensis]KAH9480624.1 hypothetical protein JR316_0007224 [Psilocybe cubensis]